MTETVHAGPLSLAIDGPDLRWVEHDGVELARRIYVAVRNLNWDTVAGVVLARELDIDDDCFALRMEVEHRAGMVAFAWTLEATGGPGPTLSYAMRGRALADFEYAKIGLNVHHPIDGLAGRMYVGDGPGGGVRGRMPEHVHPQIHLHDDGWDLPIFPPASGFTLDHEAGVVRLSFSGGLYEMEDQRNWTDQSYKTSSMPAFLGYRHTLSVGDELVQQLHLTFEPSPQRARQRRVGGVGPPRTTSAVASLDIGQPLGQSMPPLGLCHAGVLADPLVSPVALLGPAHLRLDIDLGLSPDIWRTQLREGLDACNRVNAGAELAICLAGDPRGALEVVGSAVRDSGVPPRRVIVFREDEESTATTWVRLTQASIPLDAPVGGGTNKYFAELNRSLPDLRPFGVIAFSMNPQIHAFDEHSLVENLEGQAAQVHTARAFAAGIPLAVTPVSLKPRFNAVAQTAITPTRSDQLPANVDRRQATLFASAWTLGSLKHLCEAGANSLTYYETTGPRGVVDDGSCGIDPFLLPPGTPYPLFHVLADAAALVGSEILACQSGEEPWLCGMAVRNGERLVVLAANLAPVERLLKVRLPSACKDACQRTLDATTMTHAAHQPSAFRSQAQATPVRNHAIEIGLGPYATVRVDVQ